MSSFTIPAQSPTPSNSGQMSSASPVTETPPQKKLKISTMEGKPVLGQASPKPKKDKKQTLSGPTTPKSAKAPKCEGTPQANGAWSGDKKAQLLEDILVAGYKACDLGMLAEKLQVSRQQITNQLAPSRSNLRSGAIKWARGE